MTSPDDARLPDALAARFEVVELLAGGGARIVARVIDRDGGHPRVLKALDTARVDPTEVARFRQEAAALERLQHPRVLRLREHGEEGGVEFYTAPDVGARSLRARLDPGAPLAAGTVTRLVEQVLEALEAVHDAGLVHRDVTPANVLELPDGNFQLLDFGISRRVEVSSALTETGELLGTPAWMAPEQVMGRPPDPRDDLYSLGLVAYAALRGANPKESPDLEEVLHRQLHAPLPPLGPEVPRPLAALVADLTARRREDRPASAAAARTRVPRVAPPEASAPRRGGRALAGILVVGAAAFLLTRGGPPPAPTPEPPPAERLGRALTAIDRDPAIAAGLVVHGVRASPEGRRAWDAARHRFRGLARALRPPLAAAAAAPPTPQLATIIHQLWLRAELLHRTALPDPPPRGPLLEPLAHAAGTATATYPGPWVATPRGGAPDQAEAYHRALAAPGTRWQVLRRAADYYMESGGALRHEDGLKILDLKGEPFVDPVLETGFRVVSGMMKDGLAYRRDDVPTEITLSLTAPPGRDLWLAVVMPVWRRSAVPELRLVGTEDTARLTFPVPGHAPHGRGTFTGTALVRVDAGAVPAGTRRAVLAARSVQPFASPHQLCRVAEVLQLVEGEIPSARLEAWREAGAAAWRF
jgi:serine/threonine protein kinase